MILVCFSNGCVKICPGKMNKVEMSMANDLNICFTFPNATLVTFFGGSI